MDLGMGRNGIEAILAAGRSGKLKALVLQGPELLRFVGAADALATVPFIAVMASHDGPGLERAHVLLPAAGWAEVDGTFTNYQRRVQRIRRAVAAPGEALPRWELAGALLRRLGAPLAATSARELFAEIARTVPAYAGLDVRAVGAAGRVLPPDGPAHQEARA
jgi:predicted molibdopterin-dependent oxidoreductase YjgC